MIKNPQLLETMLAVARSNTSETRTVFYKALLDSILLIPTPELPRTIRPGVQHLKKSTPLQIIGLTDNRGKNVTAVFTDEEALRQWDNKIAWFGMEALTFFRLVLATNADEIVINPFDPNKAMIRPTGRLTREEFSALANENTSSL